jgi:hypothetical protein
MGCKGQLFLYFCIFGSHSCSLGRRSSPERFALGLDFRLGSHSCSLGRRSSPELFALGLVAVLGLVALG